MSKDYNPFAPFTVDVDAIAAGIRKMIDRHPDRACVALGMLPADIMLCLDKSLEEKIPTDYYLPGAGNLDGRFREDGARIRKEIAHAVTVAIYRLSPEMIV